MVCDVGACQINNMSRYWELWVTERRVLKSLSGKRTANCLYVILSTLPDQLWYRDVKVGDNPTSISPNNTLENLYLKPLDWLLDAANKANSGNETWCISFLSSLAVSTSNEYFSGVFATAPYMPLQIVVDIQSDGSSWVSPASRCTSASDGLTEVMSYFAKHCSLSTKQAT